MDELRLKISKIGENITEQVTQNISRIFEENLLIIEENYEKLKGAVDSQEKRI